MQEASLDSFKCRRTLEAGGKAYAYYDLKLAEQNGLAGIGALPFSLKVLLENLLRHEDGRTVTREDIEAMAEWLVNRGKADREIAFRPARVLMQDFTGVPAVVDLAAMRDAIAGMGGDPARINPLAPAELVIDLVMVDFFARAPPFGRMSPSNMIATASATSSNGGKAPSSFRVAARHRHLPPGQSRIPCPHRVEPRGGSARRHQSRSPSSTRWSAPTATPHGQRPCRSAGASA
jgi:hypothetical protein